MEIEIGLAFKTKEQIKTKLFQLKIEQRMRVIAEELNDGVELDWDNIGKFKYCLGYDVEEKKPWLLPCNLIKSNDIYCLSDQFLSTCIERIGEQELIKYYKSL